MHGLYDREAVGLRLIGGHREQGEFEACGLEISNLTRDLHASGFAENIETEHEKTFTEEGKKIKFLIARQKQTEPSQSD